MKPNFSSAWLASGVLLLSGASAAFAQIGAQITPNSVGGKAPVAASHDAAADVPGSGLRMVPEGFAGLTLAPGFLLDLNVLDDSDLAGSFRVDQQGNIALPVLGNMHVAGETVSAARLQIRERLLKDRILKDPQVNLAVVEYTAPEVTIVGEVANPGKYPLLVPRRLAGVLALAGGTTLTASDEVEIVHGAGSAPPLLVHYTNAADPASLDNAMVDPGDTVQVKRAGIVYVLGAVNRPGGYVMQEAGTLNVLQAIALANGTSIAAKTGELHIIRREIQGGISNTVVSYKQLTRGKVPDIQLHAQDVLYVPVDKLKAMVTSSTAILSSAASASIYVAADR